MSKVKIDTNIVNSATSAFSAKIGVIETLSAALSVARGVAHPIESISQGLSGGLAHASNLVSDVQADIDDLTRTVRAITADYEAVEQRVFSKIGGDGELSAQRWVKDGSVLSGTVASPFTVLGPGAVVTGSFSLLHGKAESTGITGLKGKIDKWESKKPDDKYWGKGKFSNKDKDESSRRPTIGGSVLGISGEGSLVEAGGEISNGAASGSANIKFGTASGYAGIYANTDLKDFEVAGKIGVSASAVSVAANGKYGSDEANVHASGQVDALTAEAQAKAQISKKGLSLEAGAEVCAVKGTAKSGITLFGIDFDVSITGKAGALGANASAGLDYKHVGGKIGLSAALGLEVGFNVDWSNAKIPGYKEIKKYLKF